MPRSKTSKKKTHRRRRRGGFMSYLPSWLGGPPDTMSSPAPALAPPSPTPTFSTPSLPPLGGKSRRRRKH